MIAKEIKLEPNGAVLQCYQQHQSGEIPNMAKRPAILVFPGGGYRYCSDREAEPVAFAFLHYGYNAFVLRYTVTGPSYGSPQKDAEETFESALADAQAALSYLRSNADELCIYPDRIAVIGFSAGGNLAAALSTVSEIKPNALVLGYTAVDDRVNSGLGVRSPILYEQVKEDAPPTFLFTTQADTVVQSANTLRFALALAERNIPYETHIFATGDHALSLSIHASGTANSDVAQWHPMCIKFLDHIWNRHNLLWGDDQIAEKLSVDSRVDMLLANRSAVEIINHYLPGILDRVGKQPKAASLSLRKVLAFAGGKLPEELFEKINDELAQL